MNDKYKLVPVEPTQEMINATLKSDHAEISPRKIVEQDYKAMLAAAPAVQGEPIGWYTEDHLDDKSATTYSAEVAQRWRDKGWPVWPLYTAPQPSEQVENWRHDSEDLETLHHNLDDVGVPRCDSAGIEYSAWGRVIQYAKAAAKAEARNE